MGHVVRERPWGVIDIVTDEGRVFFQQRWKYNFQVRIPMALWTPSEEWDFHNRVDRFIWGSWSNRVRLNVSGTADFARRNVSSGVSINFDIRRVQTNEHWNVTVWKLTDNVFEHSTVDFPARQIVLNTNTATTTRQACNAATPAVCRPGFRSATHEFGHTIRNPDEYTATSPNLSDTDSIMNIGQRLRTRHLRLIVDELNTMIPNCTFAVGAIR